MPEHLQIALELDEPAAEGPMEWPEGYGLSDKLRMIASWLAEDADLPAGEGEAYADAITEAAERIDRMESAL